MRRGKFRQVPLFHNIDATPFAAVMLALFAMCWAPIIHDVHRGGVSVDLPKTVHPVEERGALREDAIFITVTHDGKVYFDQDQVDPLTISGLLRERIMHGSPPKVYFKVDMRARYGRALEVLSDVRSVGVENVAFIVEESSPHSR